MGNILYTPKEGNSIVVPVYNGRIIDQMPKLIVQGYTPITVAQIMEQRILAWQSLDFEIEQRLKQKFFNPKLKNKELATVWGNNSFYSGDSIIYHPDGRIKVVHDSKTLRCINDTSPLKLNGSLVLPEGTFETAEGQEFSREDVDKFTGKYLKQKEVFENPIWQALARGDKELLKTYVGQVYSKNNDPDLMKIHVSKEKSDFEAERPWYLNGLGISSAVGSDINGLLDNIDGHLIGIPQKLEDKLN